MKIPDNFDELNKLFKSSEDDVPVDFAEFLEEPMPDMVIRLGKAVQRLAKLQVLAESGQYEEGALDSFFEDFVGTCKKYMTVLKARKDEFIQYIQKIDTGNISEYVIMENPPAVCVAITRHIQGDDEDEDDGFDPYAEQPDEEPVFSCNKCQDIRYTHELNEDGKCGVCGGEVFPGEAP